MSYRKWKDTGRIMHIRKFRRIVEKQEVLEQWRNKNVLISKINKEQEVYSQ